MVSLLLFFLLGAYYFFSSQVVSLSQDGTHLGSPHFDCARGQEMTQVKTSPAGPLHRALNEPFKAVAPWRKGGFSVLDEGIELSAFGGSQLKRY